MVGHPWVGGGGRHLDADFVAGLLPVLVQLHGSYIGMHVRLLLILFWDDRKVTCDEFFV